MCGRRAISSSVKLALVHISSTDNAVLEKGKSDMYPRVEKQSGLMGLIVWQGKEYPSGVLPPENVVCKILWEPYEVNFIHELQSLDCHACHNLDLLNAAQLFDRQIEISQYFHMSSF